MSNALFPVHNDEKHPALLDAAESWAVEQGYREMASDALLNNDVSHEAHRRSGYVEVDRVITYRKSLPQIR